MVGFRADGNGEGDAPSFNDMCKVKWSKTGQMGEYKIGRRKKFQLSAYLDDGLPDEEDEEALGGGLSREVHEDEIA